MRKGKRGSVGVMTQRVDSGKSVREVQLVRRSFSSDIQAKPPLLRSVANPAQHQYLHARAQK
jgi:hypothetical protein